LYLCNYEWIEGGNQRHRIHKMKNRQCIRVIPWRIIVEKISLYD
jgi:hypothetical protein